MKKFFIALIILLLTVTYAYSAKFYWATGLTGGGGALDGIDGTDLVAGDAAIVVLDSGTNAPVLYFYRLQASGTGETSPVVISPNYNAGNNRWHLAALQIGGATNNAYIGITNNTTRAPTATSYELYPETVWKVNTNGTETYMGHFVTAPVSSNGTCTQGQFSADVNYIYVCYLTNTWARSATVAW